MRIFLVSQILDQVTSLGSARDVLPTHYLAAWTDLFAQPIDATNLGWGVLQAVAWSTALLSASWWWFQHKDITS